MIDPGEQKENNTITITCTALTPCPQSPPTLTWNLSRQPKITRHQNKDGTFTSKIQHAITLSDHHDGLNIQCKASYPVNIGNGVKLSDRNLTLRVLYAPKNTTAEVSPSTVESAGTFVNLSCSSRANPPVSLFTWFWISSEGAVNVSVGDLFTVNVTERQEYYCEARNQLGAGTSQRITLSVPATFEVSVLWSIMIAATVGLVLLMCLVMYFCWLRSAQRLQRRTDEDLVNGESKVDEDIHYGEIHFSKQAPKSAEVFTEQTETVYSQIKVSRPAGPSGGVQAQVESS
ncbi:B-cell receptor CD22-like isoform X2 [Synchiropus splendidus]|nr:B-cell receptor CD22-like isoform X2 [Synchiropus splendidus]